MHYLYLIESKQLSAVMTIDCAQLPRAWSSAYRYVPSRAGALLSPPMNCSAGNRCVVADADNIGQLSAADFVPTEHQHRKGR